MNNYKAYIRFTWVVAVFVFLVILAGSVVRMTQSGMGCPDWPTCFGKWIPPTKASQLPPDFEKYLKKQDIDHSFNVYHTWIEYINRLCGALLGLWMLIHVVWSYKKFFNTRRNIFWLSVSFLLLVVFEAWLGKVVVDTNLSVVKITLHMLLALLIAAVAIVIISQLDTAEKIDNKRMKWVANIALLALLVQIVIGTDVREQIDEISKSFDYQFRNLWIEQLDKVFIIHRSFSWVVAIMCITIMVQSHKIPALKRLGVFIAILVLCLITIGVIMAYGNIPAAVQPMHIMLSSILFISLLYYRLKFK